MGKSKRFIAKNEGQRFHLMHRSQTDKAYAGEDRPSDFVLVLASERNGSREQPNVIRVDEVLTKRRDHINALGFKNDGYDYSKHLKEMGGGQFIGRDGKLGVVHYPPSAIELPEDSLPSLEELERDLNAITISDKVMDEDIKEALFGETDVFEELLDDFVVQAMQEPDTPDFDFDAHIAALIERSERMAKGNDALPRGWNDEIEYDEEDDELSVGFSEVTESVSGPGPRGRVLRSKQVSAEQQAVIDAEFEKTLQEYDDAEIGDLGEVR